MTTEDNQSQDNGNLESSIRETIRRELVAEAITIENKRDPLFNYVIKGCKAVPVETINRILGGK